MPNTLRVLRVLVACEESQMVCTAFRDLGHEAYSCDIQECSGGHPEWHILGDCIPLLNGCVTFDTVDGTSHTIDSPWDIIIAHPPCTYLTNAQAPLYSRAKFGDAYVDHRLAERGRAIEFFMQFTRTNCQHIAIENPVGIMSRLYRKPDCIINPYQFGHPYAKKTCLWLTGLPKLQPTEVLEMPKDGWANWRRTYKGRWDTEYFDESGKVLGWGSPELSKLRSKTYEGVAKAIAAQFSAHVIAKDRLLGEG